MSEQTQDPTIDPTAPADLATAEAPLPDAPQAGTVREPDEGDRDGAETDEAVRDQADQTDEADQTEESGTTTDGDEDVRAGADDQDADDPDEDGGDDDGADERSDDPLDAEGEIAADYLEELLDIADLDGDIDTFVDSGRAHVSVVTDSQVLVGKDGAVLEALQDLVRLAVIAETGHRSRLMLDIAGHREKRRRELIDLAADAVQEARDSSEPVRLSPMNPFERKIVHDAVAAAGLTSESEGEEPQRRVVVMP